MPIVSENKSDKLAQNTIRQ